MAQRRALLSAAAAAAAAAAATAAPGALFCGETAVRGMDDAVRLRCDTHLFGGNICNTGNWLAISATCAAGTGTANGGASCAVNGTACPLPNAALWPAQWNLTLSTAVEPGRDVAPNYFNFTDAQPWGLVSLDNSAAEQVWGPDNRNRNDTMVEATLSENCRRIKAVSPGTRCLIYHNLELALQSFESQRAVMYDPAL